jgi:cysteinyl-tRNA synthetase
MIRRYLEYRGFQVRHVQNFTDIDDKIIARGASEGTSAEVAARKYTESYFEAMRMLNVAPATAYPTVTGSMAAIIEFVEALLEKGFAYVADGDVYFAVETFPDYGKLSGRTPEGQLVGVRKELEPGKRDPRDFALWKAAKAGEPSWPSPWGQGRPGWHIECSTMVRETLGEQIDIHSGGRDLIFPHHENEIAQSEARTGKAPFARYWPHVGLVTTGGDEGANAEKTKMSHSLENFTTVHDIVDRYDPVALRLYLLSTHYRAPLAFSEEGLREKVRALDRLRSALEGFDNDRPATDGWAELFKARFQDVMDDDFNSAAALGTLFDLAREINRRRAADDGLGLTLEPVEKRGTAEAEPFIELLIELRARLREARQWALADQVRDGLRARKVVVEDQPDRTVWRWARADE